MKKEFYLKIMFLFSLIGALFSGYLTFTKYFLGSCPLNEGCLYLFGYPTCVYGLVMFLVLLVASYFLLFNKKYSKKTLLKIIFYVSLLGMVFSGYYMIQEIFFPACVDCVYTLLLPTCVYGFFMYLVIFLSSILYRKS